MVWQRVWVEICCVKIFPLQCCNKRHSGCFFCAMGLNMRVNTGQEYLQPPGHRRRIVATGRLPWQAASNRTNPSTRPARQGKARLQKLTGIDLPQALAHADGHTICSTLQKYSRDRSDIPRVGAQLFCGGGAGRRWRGVDRDPPWQAFAETGAASGWQIGFAGATGPGAKGLVVSHVAALRQGVRAQRCLRPVRHHGRSIPTS